MAKSTSKRSEKMTDDSVITKADLLKTHKIGNKNLTGVS